MSADGGLSKKMKELSKGNSKRYKKWMNELDRYDIVDMNTLKKVAASSAWKDCKFTPALRAMLDDWAQQQNITPYEKKQDDYSDHFYWSKTLASRPFALKTPPEQATFYISSIASTLNGMKQLKKSYYMEKYASTSDIAKQLEYSATARLSSAEKEYAKFFIPAQGSGLHLCATHISKLEIHSV